MAVSRDGFATLSSGLLARKGAARPAMRPQGHGADDLGWNDMGGTIGGGGTSAVAKRRPITFGAPTLSAERPEVLRQQDEIAREFAPIPADPVPADPLPVEIDEVEIEIAAGRSIPVAGLAKKRAAFTLRLDPERHLRLRLACALDGRSAQRFVTAALDRLLAEQPALERIADTVQEGKNP